MRKVQDETRPPDLICEADRLSAGGGLFLLITRMLDRLKPGQVLQVNSGDPSVEHEDARDELGSASVEP